MKLNFLFALFMVSCSTAISQADTVLYVKDAIAINRIKEYRNTVNNDIIKNLSLPLTDSTERRWRAAFYAMEVINYKSLWADDKIARAVSIIQNRSIGFQQSMLELLYTSYPKIFLKEIKSLAEKTTDVKIFAMCVTYLNNPNITSKNYSLTSLQDSVIYKQLVYQFNKKTTPDKKMLAELFMPSFLSGNILLISIQRKNRNYPGIAIIRDKSGNFVTDETGKIFSVPQLALSISNMPSYITNGNTPQGIFKMNGFDVSKSMAIGPTTNIQLMMPYETTPTYFLNDSSITDTIWEEKLYKRLLPDKWKKYRSVYESYYASAAGRTEIIAHGTTVNTDYYRNQVYYPLTPTQGCLGTKEIWSNTDGKIVESDQQKLVNALKKTGGADGYCFVFEIDDAQKPVNINEILPYIKNSR